MDAVDIAWIAGMVEGEGSIVCGGTQGVHTTMLSVTGTDEDTIRRLRDLSGVGRMIHGPYPHGNSKPIWMWRTTKKKDLARLFLAIYPLMGERRSAKIAEALPHVAWTCVDRPIAHGTNNGYHQERRRGLETCPACREAHRVSGRRWLPNRAVG